MNNKIATNQFLELIKSKYDITTLSPTLIRNISANPNITWEIILSNKDINWDWKGVSMNPSITWTIIETNYNKPWDWKYVSMNPSITEYIIEDNDYVSWDWDSFSYNPSISWKFINSTIDYSSWDWSGISSNPNITWEIIQANYDKLWNWENISANSCITWDIIKANSKQPWDWKGISRNPNITWDIIEDNPLEPWDWPNVSQNPNITWDIIQDTISTKPWSWEGLSKNPRLFSAIKNNPDKPWSWENVTNNKFKYDPFFIREKKKLIEQQITQKKFTQADINQVVMALNGATELIVQTPDEFLKSFSVSNFNVPKILNYMKSLEIKANIIGEPSAFGVIYEIPNKNQVLKIFNVCNGSYTQMASDMCKMAENGDIIYRFPNTTENKLTVFAPNYISEPIIGILLSRLSNYTPGFMNVSGFQYDSSDAKKPLYIISEKLTPSTKFIREKNNKEYLYAIFQIAQALNTAQMMYKYTHYDLHMGNFMVRPSSTKRRKLSIYELGNGEYLYTYFDFDTVIIDYGLNRLETKENILVGRLLYNKHENNYPDILDYGAFNPYIDLFEIIHYIYLYDTQVDDPFIYDMLCIILGIDINTSENDLDEIIDEIISVGINWRAAPEKLAMKFKQFEKCLTPQEFMIAIAKYIKLYQQKFAVPNSEPENIKKYIERYNFLVSDKIIKIDSNTTVYMLPPKKDRLNTEYLNYEVASDYLGRIFTVKTMLPTSVPDTIRKVYDKRFNKTITTGIDSREQHIHIAKINVNLGISEGYKFNFECCRIDLRTYMQNSDRNGCIAMNAGFFRIYEDYTPVGYYKSNNYTSSFPVPDRFKEYYCLLYINENGTLSYDKNIDNYARYNPVITVGPLLVEKGIPVITDDDLLNNPLFQSDSTTKIKPGELYHLANPNPRSALVSRKNGDVLFVHVEGRGDSGAGMDASQLAQLCVSLDAVWAINMDGGRSSQITWRAPNSDIISVDKYTNAYPVGTIISFCRK